MVRKFLTLNNATIGPGAYRNFSGAAKFGKAGKRTFTILLNEDIGKKVEERGWYIRWRDPRDDQEGRTALLDVEVRYDKYPPERVTLTTNGDESELDESNIGLLDDVDIGDCRIVLRPYNWEVNGKTGTKAYLHILNVTQKEYGTQKEYAEDEFDC